VLAYYMLGLVILLWLCAYKLMSRKKRTRLTLLLFLAALFVATAYALRAPIVLGESSWYNTTPWREIFFFMAMIFGMVANPLGLAIKDRHKEIRKLRKQGKTETPKLFLDKLELARPLLLSGVVFGVLYPQIADKGLSLATFTMAFQNGFFWENVLKQR
jgi:hypothetical protein